MELDFLVESGLGFGFILGLGQMIAWVIMPKPWTLPVCFCVELLLIFIVFAKGCYDTDPLI